MKIKKLITISLILGMVSITCACSKKPIEADLHKTYEDNREIKISENDSDFVLTTPGGLLTLYNVTGKSLGNLQLESTSKSDFIYCEDSGDIYSKNILDISQSNTVFYALDKSNGRLYVVKNDGNNLKVVKDKTLKQSKNVKEIKAYDGLVYYLVRGNGLAANTYTVAKSQDEIMNGVIDTSTSVPVKRRGKTYSYIFVENMTEYYLKGMNYDGKLDKMDNSNMNLLNVKRDSYMIPFEVTAWSVTNNEIIYFAEKVSGKYNMTKNILTANYGTINAIDTFYFDGRGASVYSFNQLGAHSEKTILLKADPDTLEIEKALEYEGAIPIDSYIDKLSNKAYVVYKENNLATYGKVKVLNLTTFKEEYSLALDFVPTTVVGHNGYYYVMNNFEDFFIVGNIGSKDYQTFSKYIKNENVNDVLMCNVNKKDLFKYDADGRYIDEDGKLLDYRGNLINEKSKRVNRYGQLLNDYGQAVNTNGELVDKYSNIIDENGTIIKYTKQDDGYYRSGNGKVVDENGKAMIRQEDGSYIKDEEEIEEVRWHYDEEGKKVIDADYLEKYPDAYSWINDTTGEYTKGKSNTKVTAASENKESDSKKSIFTKLTESFKKSTTNYPKG